MENNQSLWGSLLIGALVGFLLGYHFGMGNQSLKYGDSGFPKNCRAIIADNLEGFWADEYKALDVIASIERNCGANGSSWGER